MVPISVVFCSLKREAGTQRWVLIIIILIIVIQTETMRRRMRGDVHRIRIRVESGIIITIIILL